MPDLLTRLARAPISGPLIQALGIQAPAELTRATGGYDAEPLTGQAVLATDTALVREPLERLGARDLAATHDLDVLVHDATEARTPGDLDDLYASFHEHVPELAACGKVLVLAPDPSQATDPRAAATARAIEGFTRSLAKELGRRGATANLLRVADGAEDRLVGPMRFLLTPRSAYVSGQALQVTDDVAAPRAAPTASLEGKRAVVTGAARGLGEATARRLAEEGARVVGVDLPSAQERLDGVVDEIGGEAVTVDITADDAASVLPAPDVLVHNAGVTRDKILHRMTPEMWRTVLEVNLAAILQVDEALLPEMADGGRAIYMSSVTGLAGNAGQTNYAATKAGILGYVEAQAPRLADRGITVNAVAPGFIETAMTEEMPATRRLVAARLNSLSQAGQPRDVAEAVTFLASPESHGVTGQTLRVCGQALMGA